MSYIDYVNSFYSNDVNVLQKRKKQSKTVGTLAATAGAVAGGLCMLPKNKVKLPCAVASFFLLLSALNTHNYVKSVDKKISALNANV